MHEESAFPGAGAPLARFGGLLATEPVDVTDDPAALDSTGWWAVAVDYEGRLRCVRFGRVRPDPAPPRPAGRRHAPDPGRWTSSLSREIYTDGVRRIREHIAAGEVYQANLCRVLSAPVGRDTDPDALAADLAAGNPAPHAGVIRLPSHGVEIACASPELFLRRRGAVVESGPIKGTGRTEADLLEKDHAENVMIVDLVRNDLGRVCAPGTVTVPRLCEVEAHPGLVHLVSTVRGELRDDAGWPELLAATFPPGSVTGAPKTSALRILGDLETVPRGPYCGAVGWVDADRRHGELAVGIRTFWIERARSGAGELRFGTGAGITWGSDPEREWRETELKAARLLAIAAGRRPGPAFGDVAPLRSSGRAEPPGPDTAPAGGGGGVTGVGIPGGPGEREWRGADFRPRRENEAMR
ncbi:chorismate-binding protein [Streptomyces sp. ST2-7A]|uniref:chorismate-binding protein n=1 Tax=Streptomyces sp. ST2-7A TaxID=2907214 RepID=UPI001F4357EF|nr:chorismate-binding protein [Streptomyces sp. ST2-7A]MCE7079742.1 chorismate-binding protein [Streptomyces sp. ST2-7A]